ncbi:MAG: hypothetical protein ABI832_01955 [bacterium]
MAQIQELEQRITAAFQRISAGVEALSVAPKTAIPEPVPAPPVAPLGDDGVADLQEALDEERMANAQLTERLRVFRENGSTTEQGLRAEVETLTRALDAQGLDVQRLSSTVAQLREDLRRLREAAEQGIVDPALINRAMMAELEALLATRSAETNEMHEILTALGSVLDAEEAHANA